MAVYFLILEVAMENKTYLSKDMESATKPDKLTQKVKVSLDGIKQPSCSESFAKRATCQRRS